MQKRGCGKNAFCEVAIIKTFSGTTKKCGGKDKKSRRSRRKIKKAAGEEGEEVRYFQRAKELLLESIKTILKTNSSQCSLL